jgi:hypothetical protein
MRTLIQKQKAWLTNPGQVDSLLKGEEVSFSLTDGDMTEHGWVLLGEATVMVRLEDEDKLVLDTVARLEEAARKLQADTHVKLMKLQEMKNNLLSLTYTSYTEPLVGLPPTLKAAVPFDDDIPF